MTGRRLTAIGAALAMLATVVTITAPAGAQDPLTCNGKPVTHMGTAGDDRIEGTEGNDVMVGLTGKDVIFGRGGNDTICGGPGNDVIKGGRGNDFIQGDTGNDKLLGGSGKDTLDGGKHKDKVFGGNGPDTLAGGDKRDAVRGQSGVDTCDLDHFDVFASCETGDVVGVNGAGIDVTVPLDVPSDFAFNRVDFGPLALQNIEEDYVVEIYWELEPESPWVAFELVTAADDLILFELLEGDSGIARFVTSGGPPASLIVDNATYFEFNVMRRENLQKLSRNVSGRGAWVYQLAEPIDGLADYVFTHDGTDEFATVFLHGQFGDFGTFVWDEDVVGQLAGTTRQPVEAVEVDVDGEWSITVAPAA